MMVWIDSVRSAWNHSQKVSASATAKTTVVVTRLTPKLSTRLSVTSVPTIEISTTASQ